MNASHTYLAAAAWFGRDSVALPGLEKYFRLAAEEERSHAQKLINYMNTRGGQVVLQEIPAPETDWKSAKYALETALNLEKQVNTSLLVLHSLAGEQGDANLADYLESEFLNEQVESMKKLADMLTQLNRVGNDGLGLFLYDKELLSELKS